MSLPWRYEHENGRWECGDKSVGPYFEISLYPLEGSKIFAKIKVFYEGFFTELNRTGHVIHFGSSMYDAVGNMTGYTYHISCEEDCMFDSVEKAIAKKSPEVYFRALLVDLNT